MNVDPSQYIPQMELVVFRSQSSGISLSKSQTTGPIFIFREAILDKDCCVLEARLSTLHISLSHSTFITTLLGSFCKILRM